MKPSFRITALVTTALMFAACGRPERSVVDSSTGTSKQTQSEDFVYQDRIPLIQIVNSFSQESMGIMKTKFTLSQRAHVNYTYAVVKVNNQIVKTGYYINGQHLVFDSAPAASSHIKVSFDPESLRDSLALTKITLPENLELSSIRALFNGRPLFLEDLRMSRSSSGELILDPAAIVFDHNDSFELIKNRGLSLEVSALKSL